MSIPTVENLHKNKLNELSAEQSLDYLVNLNNLLKVRNKEYKKKFLQWKEMNYFKVRKCLQFISKSVNILLTYLYCLQPV